MMPITNTISRVFMTKTPSSAPDSADVDAIGERRPHSACQADGRRKSAVTKAALPRFLDGMILERKELPGKSADGAPFNSKFRRPRDAGWRKEGMVQPWRTLGTVVAHTVSKEGCIFSRAPLRPRCTT